MIRLPFSRPRGALVATALCLLLSARPALAGPTAEEKAGARAAATQANAAFAAKKYAEALELLTRAESLVHAPTHMLMLARTQVALGQLVKGRESYQSLIREPLGPTAPPAFKKAQADAKPELEALEPRVPTINVKVDIAAAKDVVITMDGVTVPSGLVGFARPVDPGDHVFKARAKGFASEEKTVKIAEGSKVDLVLKLNPAPEDPGPGPATPEAPTPAPAPAPNKTMKTLGYVGVGVGIAGVGVGAVLSGLGFSKRDEATKAYAACGSKDCVRGTPGADKVAKLDGDANTMQTAGLISLIAGGVIGGTGVALLVLSPKQEPRQGSITPFIGPSSVGVSGTF